MMPLAVFRRVAIPVMVLDPEAADDNLPVGDQNDRLAALHPGYVIHQRYPDTGHDVVKLRPDWFVRDAVALLGRVRRGGTEAVSRLRGAPGAGPGPATPPESRSGSCRDGGGGRR